MRLPLGKGRGKRTEAETILQVLRNHRKIYGQKRTTKRCKPAIPQVRGEEKKRQESGFSDKERGSETLKDLTGSLLASDSSVGEEEKRIFECPPREGEEKEKSMKHGKSAFQLSNEKNKRTSPN